jgi:hypothetical protein
MLWRGALKRTDYRVRLCCYRQESGEVFFVAFLQCEKWLIKRHSGMRGIGVVDILQQIKDHLNHCLTGNSMALFWCGAQV